MIVDHATATQVSLTEPTVAFHGAGSRLLDVSLLADPAEAGSRLWDVLTKGEPEWYAYAYRRVEQRQVKTTRDALIEFPVERRPVIEVEAFAYHLRGVAQAGQIQGGPWDAGTPDQTVWFDDDAYRVTIDPYAASGSLSGGTLPICGFDYLRGQITYTGGYAYPGLVVPHGAPSPLPMPMTLRRGAAALAARLWKEKDSGFSDTLGSAETGTLTYKKEAPADVARMAKSFMREIGWGT